jgi:hypothetical protein
MRAKYINNKKEQQIQCPIQRHSYGINSPPLPILATLVGKSGGIPLEFRGIPDSGPFFILLICFPILIGSLVPAIFLYSNYYFRHKFLILFNGKLFPPFFLPRERRSARSPPRH